MNATPRNALVAIATLAALATSLAADAAASVPGTCDLVNTTYCSGPFAVLQALLQLLG